MHTTSIPYYQDTYGLRYYAKAQNLARLGAAQYDAKLEEYSVLIMPTITFRPPKILPPGLKEGGKVLCHWLTYVGNCKFNFGLILQKP